MKTQLPLVVATATLLSIICNGATTQTSSTAAGQTSEIHSSGAHKNMAHVYANHLGQQQKQQQQQQYPSQQYYYDFHYKQNGSSSGGKHNGIATPTATKPVATTEAEEAAEADEVARKAARRSYSGINIRAVGGSSSSYGGNSGGGGEWRHIHNGGNGGNGRNYNFGVAKLNDLTNLSGLQHITSGFGSSSSSWNTAGHGGSSVSDATTKAVIPKHHIPIYEEQQENDYGAATLGASGAAGHTVGENNQHGSNSGSIGSSWVGSSGSSSSSGTKYYSASGNDALTTALYNLHTAGTHNGFLPAYDGKYKSSFSSGVAQHSTPQIKDKISDGNFLHRYGHNSGGYDELSAAATYEHEQHQQPTSSALQYYSSPHDSSYSSSHSGPDSASSSGLGTDIDVSFGGHYGGGEGASLEEEEAGSSHSYDDSSNYLPEQHQSDGGHSAPDIINYIPYPVVKKVHVPVRENVQIPVSHAVIVPVSKPVPIHIPVTKHVPVPVEKELRVPVERVVPYPVEKPVAVPVEKRVPFEVVKYVTVKVPHPFPVKVPVFKTILHKIHKVQKGGWW